VTVIDPRTYMTYQPFLPEVMAGSIEPNEVNAPSIRARNETQSGIVPAVKQKFQSEINRGSREFDYVARQRHGPRESFGNFPVDRQRGTFDRIVFNLV
jgi:hypothetical protein